MALNRKINWRSRCLAFGRPSAIAFGPFANAGAPLALPTGMLRCRHGEAHEGDWPACFVASPPSRWVAGRRRCSSIMAELSALTLPPLVALITVFSKEARA